MIIRKLEERDKKQVENIFDLYWNDSFRENLQEKLEGYLERNDNIISQNFNMFVLEEDNYILGVAAYRDAPSHMIEYVSTSKPAEMYVVAVKEKGKGVGTKLRDYRIQTAREEGFTELLFFSGESHKDSWGFHDNSDFERVSEALAPNGEKGYIWRMVLTS